jgi:hypothetical protein
MLTLSYALMGAVGVVAMNSPRSNGMLDLFGWGIIFFAAVATAGVWTRLMNIEATAIWFVLACLLGISGWAAGRGLIVGAIVMLAMTPGFGLRLLRLNLIARQQRILGPE